MLMEDMSFKAVLVVLNWTLKTQKPLVNIGYSEIIQHTYVTFG